MSVQKKTVYRRVLYLFMVIALFGCSSNKDRTTNTFSSSFTSKKEKLAFMESYYTPNLQFKDVEYHIVYYDNESGRGPGPSDWYMYFAFKLTNEEIDRLQNQPEVEPFKIEDGFSFLQKTKGWNIEGDIKYYKGGVILVGGRYIALRYEGT